MQMQILFIEDDVQLLDSTSLRLKETMNCKVIKALSPEEGMKLFEELLNSINLVITDMHFGSKDPNGGLRIIQFLQGKQFEYVPVIVLTGFGEWRNVAECMEAGAFSYVLKGRAETFSELIQKIGHAFEHYEKQANNVVKALLSMSKVTVKMIERTDPFVDRHSYRVAEWSLAVGKKLDLSERELRDLSIGAYLHDVGKAMLPDYIMAKPGRRTSQEDEQFRLHPQKGVDLVKGIPYINENILRIIGQHHERFNGEGYPKRLKGLEIDLLASIVRAACDFDNAFSPKENRAIRDPEGAKSRILKYGDEKKIDPRVVTAFRTACEEGEIGKTDPPRESDKLFSEARRDAEAGRFEEVSMKCREAITNLKRENMCFAVAFCLAVGDLYMEHRLYNNASEYYKEASDLQPGFAEAFYKRGLSFEKQEMWERADWHYVVATSIIPTYIEAHLARGHVLFKGCYFDEAMKTYDKVITLDPKEPAAYLGKGRIYSHKWRKDAKNEDFDEAKSNIGRANDVASPKDPIKDDINAALAVLKKKRSK